LQVSRAISKLRGCDEKWVMKKEKKTEGGHLARLREEITDNGNTDLTQRR